MTKGAPVGVLLVTHSRLGHQLLATMRDFMGELTLPADVLEVRRVQDPEMLTRQGARMVERLDAGAGVLVITDAFGSTPGNLAKRVASGSRNQKTRVVAGLNLPMLMRIFNYPTQSLDQLTQTAIDGGRRGVVDCMNLTA